MSSGRPFSKREILFMRMHRKGMFASSIARQLEIRFPEDNNGSRDKDSVQRFMKRRGIIE